MSACTSSSPAHRPPGRAPWRGRWPDELDLPLLVKDTIKQALLDELRPDEELWPDAALRPLDSGWPVVEVDTSGPVDVREVAERVRRTRSRP